MARLPWPLRRRRATFEGAFVSSGALNVTHSTAHALMVPPGEFALVTVDNKRSILGGREEPYFIRSKTQFEVKENCSYRPSETRHVSHGILHYFNISVGQIAAIRIDGAAHLVKGNGKPFVLGENGERVQFNSERDFYQNTKKLIRFGDKVYLNIPANEVLACQKDGKVTFLEASENKDNQAQQDVQINDECTFCTVGETVGTFLHEGDDYGFYPTTTEQIRVGQWDRVYVGPNKVLVTQKLGENPKKADMEGRAAKVFGPGEQVLGVVDTRRFQLRMPTAKKIEAHRKDGRSQEASFCYTMDGGTKVALKIVASFKVVDPVKYVLVAQDGSDINAFLENTIAAELTGFMSKRQFTDIYHPSGTSLSLPPASGGGAQKEEQGQELNKAAQHYIQERLSALGVELESLQFEDLGLYDARVRQDLSQAAEQTLLQKAKLAQVQAQQDVTLAEIKNQKKQLEAQQQLVNAQKQLADSQRELAETKAKATGFEKLGPLVALVSLAKNHPEQAGLIEKIAAMQIAAKAAQGATFTGMSPSATVQLSAAAQALQGGSLGMFARLGSQGIVGAEGQHQVPGGGGGGE